MQARNAPALLRRSLSARTVVGLVAALIAAALLLEITEEVIQGEANAFDRTVSLWVRGYASPSLDVVMRVFTFIGSYAAIIGVSAVVAAWARSRQASALSIVLVAVVSVSIALNSGLKLIFRRSRPGLFLDVVVPATFSFPSGHSMVSLAAYGTAALIVARLQPGLRTPVYLVTPLVVFLIGLSRVYLGVHWATDVAAGFAAGTIILLAGRFAIGRFTR